MKPTPRLTTHIGALCFIFLLGTQSLWSQSKTPRDTTKKNPSSSVVRNPELLQRIKERERGPNVAPQKNTHPRNKKRPVFSNTTPAPTINSMVRDPGIYQRTIARYRNLRSSPPGEATFVGFPFLTTCANYRELSMAHYLEDEVAIWNYLRQKAFITEIYSIDTPNQHIFPDSLTYFYPFSRKPGGDEPCSLKNEGYYHPFTQPEHPLILLTQLHKEERALFDAAYAYKFQMLANPQEHNQSPIDSSQTALRLEQAQKAFRDAPYPDSQKIAITYQRFVSSSLFDSLQKTSYTHTARPKNAQPTQDSFAHTDTSYWQRAYETALLRDSLLSQVAFAWRGKLYSQFSEGVLGIQKEFSYIQNHLISASGEKAMMIFDTLQHLKEEPFVTLKYQGDSARKAEQLSLRRAESPYHYVEAIPSEFEWETAVQYEDRISLSSPNILRDSLWRPTLQEGHPFSSQTQTLNEVLSNISDTLQFQLDHIQTLIHVFDQEKNGMTLTTSEKELITLILTEAQKEFLALQDLCHTLKEMLKSQSESDLQLGLELADAIPIFKEGVLMGNSPYAGLNTSEPRINPQKYRDIPEASWGAFRRVKALEYAYLMMRDMYRKKILSVVDRN